MRMKSATHPDLGLLYIGFEINHSILLILNHLNHFVIEPGI